MKKIFASYDWDLFLYFEEEEFSASHLCSSSADRQIVFSDLFLILQIQSWATIHLKCDAGLIITASHNPKEDNGYKAYWNNGAQVSLSVVFIGDSCICQR